MTEPIRRSITVSCTPERAFEVFTEQMATWWPTDRYSLAAETDTTVADVVLEPRDGGRMYEVQLDGTEASWGQVLTWRPPSRLVLAWKPNTTPNPPTEVELTFTAVDEGTRVELEHRGWERLGADAAKARAGYASGWPLVFDELFGKAANRVVA